MIKLNAPLTEIRGIGPRFLSKLEKLGVQNVEDLVFHFPTRYEDFSQIYKIADLEPNQEATIQGEVIEVTSRRTWRQRMIVVEALISDDSGSIRAIWFNQPYIKNMLKPGRIANLSGKVARRESEVYLSNPIYELVSDAETKHTARIVPIYPETRGLTSKGLRFLIKPVLEDIEEIPDPIPKDTLKKENLPEINTAIQNIHFPENLEDALSAKRRFAFQDLFLLGLYNTSEKLRLEKEKAIKIESDAEKTEELIKSLPFDLTPSQLKSLNEILRDLEKGGAMNRLLQGDVGSGKTIIAAAAAILTAEAGYQTAFMAPTEILAQQHYKTFLKFFPEFAGGVALLTANASKTSYGQDLETTTTKQKIKKDIDDGKIKIVIGTHALIQKQINFKNLALVVIDEQHRFGIEQRKELISRNKEKNGFVPHLLSMSATPIPRTLSLAVFGDLDISLITELPKNRKEIITKAVAPENRPKAYAFIRGIVKKGRQVFVICPRIEATEEMRNKKGELGKLEVKTVKEEYEKLSKKVFPNLKVAMLHGKMKAAEKEETMNDFASGKTDVLISTSVIEVGVDIPNATVMMIEGADRFGLAQLYQFRGRVGRGKHQSFCFLFTDSGSERAEQRLKSIVEAKNGFELAEKDLAIRGPGEFLGAAQTGMPDIAMKALRNPELVKSSRKRAEEILEKDPTLKNHPLLAERLRQFKKEVHRE